MEFKNQHIVSQAFLKGWVDPLTPQGHEPYVWLISRNGTNKEKKAPKNILSETNFYSETDKEGGRNVDLEKRLSGIESNFTRIRDNKLLKSQPLTDDENVQLAEFVAASYARTQYNKDVQSQIWQDYQNLLLASNPAAADSELYREAEQLKIQPMPFFITNFLNEVMNQLLVMRLTIHQTSIRPGFITSDNPVIWIDPAVFLPGAPITFFGVGSPTLNVIMPVSPNSVITISHEYPEGYYPIENPKFVNVVNSMMVGFVEDVVVSNTDEIGDWFGNG